MDPLRRAIALLVPPVHTDGGALLRLLRPRAERVLGSRPCRRHGLEGGSNVAGQRDLRPAQAAAVLGPDVHLDDALPRRKERRAARHQDPLWPRHRDGPSRLLAVAHGAGALGRLRGGAEHVLGNLQVRHPGAPDLAWWTASSTYSGIRAVSRHSARHFVTGATAPS